MLWNQLLWLSRTKLCVLSWHILPHLKKFFTVLCVHKVLITKMQLQLETASENMAAARVLVTEVSFSWSAKICHMSVRTSEVTLGASTEISKQKDMENTDILPESRSGLNLLLHWSHQQRCWFIVSICLNNLCDIALVYLLCFSHACLKSNMPFAHLRCFAVSFPWLRNFEYLMLCEGKNIFYFLIIGAWVPSCTLSWQNSLILKQYF